MGNITEDPFTQQIEVQEQKHIGQLSWLTRVVRQDLCILVIRICPLRAPVWSVDVHKMLYHHAVFAAPLHACWSRSESPALWGRATCWSRGQDAALRNVEVLQEQ